MDGRGSRFTIPQITLSFISFFSQQDGKSIKKKKGITIGQLISIAGEFAWSFFDTGHSFLLFYYFFIAVVESQIGGGWRAWS